MKHGAVLFMDALGFKGIWRRKDVTPEAILGKLSQLPDIATSRARDSAEEFRKHLDPRLTAQVAVLSDTIVVGVSSELDNSPDAEPAEWTVICAGLIAAAIQMAAASPAPAPPLSFRGVITFGLFSMDDRFLIGPAIDEAASLERNAEAGVVWLAPSAVAVLRANGVPLDTLGFVRWAVPMKGGGSYETAVANPFNWYRLPHDEASRNQLQSSLLAQFDAPIVEVQIKKQNTERFLAQAREAHER